MDAPKEKIDLPALLAIAAFAGGFLFTLVVLSYIASLLWP